MFRFYPRQEMGIHSINNHGNSGSASSVKLAAQLDPVARMECTKSPLISFHPQKQQKMGVSGELLASVVENAIAPFL